MTGIADWIVTKVADLARPFTLYAMGFSGAYATVVIAAKVTDGNDGWGVLAAIGATVSALYAGKALEVANVSKHTAQVEVERAKASPPPEKALAPATAGDGELPPTVPEKPSWK